MGRITTIPNQSTQITQIKARHFYRWCAFFVVLFFITDSYASGIEKQYPSRLWQVQRADVANGKPSYILGTMHLADKDIVNLPPHIDSVVRKASSLTLEVKLDASAYRTMSKLSTLNGAKTLSDLIGHKDFKTVVSILKPRGITEFGLQRLKPWVVGLMLNYPPLSLDPVLDYSLQLRFERKGKPIYQLETAQEQIQLFNGLSLKEQIHFLKYSLSQYKNYDFYFNQMKKHYLNDDLDSLEALAKQQMGDVEESYLKKLFVELIDKRNLKMVDRMGVRLREGNALIAVGALHLTGDYGLIQILKDLGYTVTPITAKSH